MNHLESFYQDNKQEADFYNYYASYLNEVMTSLDKESVANVAKVFLQAREAGKTIYFAGNGGSATTATHFAQDMNEIGRKIQDKGFRVRSIADNVASLTAIGNDYDFSEIFTLQLQYCFDQNDVLVVISASGNSPNVLKAVEFVQKQGGTAVGLVGFDGGKLAEMCDHVVHVPSVKGEYGPVEDAHLIINHMIVAYLTLSLTK